MIFFISFSERIGKFFRVYTSRPNELRSMGILSDVTFRSREVTLIMTDNECVTDDDRPMTLYLVTFGRTIDKVQLGNADEACYSASTSDIQEYTHVLFLMDQNTATAYRSYLSASH